MVKRERGWWRCKRRRVWQDRELAAQDTRSRLAQLYFCSVHSSLLCESLLRTVIRDALTELAGTHVLSFVNLKKYHILFKQFYFTMSLV